MNHLVVVGVSAAGLSAARTLRAEGYDGQLTLVDADPRPPYDRTTLSKGLLRGQVDLSGIALADAAELDRLEADWRLGVRAVGLQVPERTVSLQDGEKLIFDGLVLATGSRPRRLDVPTPRGVHYLRGVDDALALREAFVPGVSVVLVGGGFIGLELAAAARLAGAEVTVLEAGGAPLERVLGSRVGEAMAQRHRARGVEVRTGVVVTGLGGADQLTHVELASGERLKADVVVVGIGAVPAADWLAGSGLGSRAGVDADNRLATDVPGVVVAGDLVRWPHPDRPGGGMLRIEHYEHAELSGGAAARRLLYGDSVDVYAPLPYVWSHQYEHVLHLAGFSERADAVQLVSGAMEDGPFVVEYLSENRRVAVAALDDTPSFRRLRRTLHPTGAPL
jgi:3-phenylpropionate/trans-cinnamate dioxygenase ferredoxin reductase subunit